LVAGALAIALVLAPSTWLGLGSGEAIAAPFSSFSSANSAPASAAPSKPNIVVIWGDDIGQSDISAYTKGLMGFRTPNIDRLADEGVLLTDYYGEQS
jgi:arylsulfatase